MHTNAKKLFNFILSITVIALLTAFSAFAVEYSADAVLWGDCGEGSNVYWEIVPNDEEGKYSMNIFGTGDTFLNLKEDGTNVGYSTYNEAKWKDYIPDLTKVYIGDNITTLGDASFVRNTAIHTVELGANVKVLNKAAFQGCSGLKMIYRTGNVGVWRTFDLTGISSFGMYLFDGCKGVNNIILPTEGSYTLKAEFLKNNTELQNLYIPAACGKINRNAFRNCTALKAVYFEGYTELDEGDITNNAGTFYSYSFHNCGVASDSGVSFSISAYSGSPAYNYALKNKNHSVTNGDSTVNCTIAYIEPTVIEVYDGSERLTEVEIVEGFTIDHEYVDGNETYIFFEDDTYTALRSTPVRSGDIIYGKKLIAFLGYMVRIKDYHGLRAIYEYDTEAFKALEGYSVLEVGVLGAPYIGIDPVLDLELDPDFDDVNKAVIYNGNTLVGRLVDLPKDGISSFAYTSTGYEAEGILSATRVASEMMFRAYVTLQNEETGETRTYYSVQGVKDLTDACEATKAAGADILNAEAMSFIQDLIDLAADSDYIYTKAEAMEHLTAVYNDPDHILSGQHIGYSKTIVRDQLSKIYKATGRFPAVLSYDVSVAYRDEDYSEEANNYIADDFAEYARQGGLISMCAHMTNPDPNQTPTDPYRGRLKAPSQWEEFFTAGSDINTNFMTELEAIGDFLQLLENRGVTVFWRPYHEANGAYFWFCGASIYPIEDYSEYYFKKLWILTYNYLENERGLDNLIWVYSPRLAEDGSDESPHDVMKYYPGDDYVDVMGIDWYTTRNIENGEIPELLDSAYETIWARLAGTYTGTDYYSPVTKQMPVVYGEFGPSDVLTNEDPTLSYNGENALELVKQVAESGRNMGYIVFWSSYSTRWQSLDLMYKADKFMQSEIVLDLAEARTLLLDLHYGK